MPFDEQSPRTPDLLDCTVRHLRWGCRSWLKIDILNRLYPSVHTSPSYMSAKAKYAKAQENIRIAREEAQKVMREAFSECALEVFRAHPEIVGFKWSQFTPYFNDGDECVFHVRSDYPNLKINPEHEFARSPGLNKILKNKDWVSGYELEFYKTPQHECQKTFEPAWNAVKEFVRGFDESDMRTMFNDHVEVTVTLKDGIVTTETDEISHD